MSNKLEAAARQALVALEDVMADFDGSWALADTAITALREALAEQTEQEPVACWLYRVGDETFGIALEENLIPEGAWKVQPLYAAPVRTKDLTDDEIADALEKTLVVEDERFEFQGGRILTIRESELLPTARAVIAAYKEKNK